MARHDLDALAAAAGVTRRTIERNHRDGAPLPKRGEGLAAWLQRYNQWREARKVRNKPPAKEGERDWEAESKKALALKRMHDLAVQRGEFMPRAEVVSEWARRVFAVRTRLLALPRTLGSRCANMPADMVEQEADDLVRELLGEFVAEGEATPAPRTEDA